MVSRVISTPFYREIEGGKEHDKAKYTIWGSFRIDFM
jgi:hypothetical protein